MTFDLRLLSYISFFCAMMLSSKCYGQTFDVVHNDTINVFDKDSLKQGIFRDFFVEGTLKEELHYKNNKRSGLALTYYRFPNCLKEEANYKNDSLHGYRIEYYRNCKVKLVETYHNGLKEGYERTYNKNGIVISEGIFKGGELDGFYKIYDGKGKLKFETSSKDIDVNLEDYVTGAIPIHDSIIIKTLERLPSTKNTTIVTDITGSMYPYVGQLLLWYKLNMENTPVRQFVFFNDGDKKRDMEKVIGRTGGIYFTEAKKLTDLKKKMESAIKGGGGGDAPENDLEAVLEASKKYRKTDKIILVVDRWSAVKDISLLRKVRIPVHVILCGNMPQINPQYLDIAKKTKGSVHTINEDILRLPQIQENETVRVGEMYYQLKRGQFRRVTEDTL